MDGRGMGIERLPQTVKRSKAIRRWQRVLRYFSLTTMYGFFTSFAVAHRNTFFYIQRTMWYYRIA